MKRLTVSQRKTNTIRRHGQGYIYCPQCGDYAFIHRRGRKDSDKSNQPKRYACLRCMHKWEDAS